MKRRASHLDVDQNGITPYLSPAKKRCPSPTVPLSVQHKSWRPSQLANYLRRHGIDNDVASKFEAERFRGEHLVELNDELLQEWGIVKGQRIEILKLIAKIVQEESAEDLSCLPKVFNDSVHGHIELDRLLIRIIDTPQFQRLRDIKQLGGSYFVFPGASHNRFEHSIGCCHLAGCLVTQLRDRQKELHISDVDVLCVKIAGLCHDLGHGPFSHMFDGQFIPMVAGDVDWTHEQASIAMLRHLIAENGLEEVFNERGICEQDLIFIEEMINGPSLPDDGERNWRYEGRGEEKNFLYEIISNKTTGIDVDKWDYFCRDCHHLGIANMFDYRRFLQFARVIEVEKKLRICTRDKEVGNLYDMFYTRNALHRRAYQHKTSNIVETMICEGFAKANDHFFLAGKDGVLLKMSEAIFDMHAYTHLSDSVFYQILASTDPNLQEAREILQAVQKRQLYRCVSQTNARRGGAFSKLQARQFEDEIVTAIPLEHLREKNLPQLSVSDICVQIVNFSYGMKHEDPIARMRFYQKHQPNKAIKVRRDQVSHMLPEQFLEQSIRLYLRDSNNRDKQRSANWCFQQWCVNTGCTMPQEGDVDGLSMTPLRLSQDPDSLPSSQTPSSFPAAPHYGSGADGGNSSSHVTPLNPSAVSQRLKFSE